MSVTNSIMTERNKFQAAIKRRKKEDKPELDGLSVFSSANFMVSRAPTDIAREFYAAMVKVPPTWNASVTEAKLKELVEAYEAQAKKVDTEAERVPILTEFFKCKKLYDNFVTAVNQPDGALRSRLYEIVCASMAKGKWKEQLEDAMERVKKEYESVWKERISAKPIKPAEKKAAKPASSAPSSSATSAATVATGFPFKNLTLYRKAQVRSMVPAFPRPPGLPANLKLWCADCCYSDHVTENCTRGKSARQPPQQQPIRPPPPPPVQQENFY